MTWPPSSPDLNPFENFWALLKKGIYSEGEQNSAQNVDSDQIKKLTDSLNGRLKKAKASLLLLKCSGLRV